jgi:sulfide:quinone oxidoreductase
LKKIVILGAGTGGTIVANILSGKLRTELKAGTAEITILGDSKYHIYQPASLFIPFGLAEARDATRDEASLLSEQIKFRQGKALEVDTENRAVKLASREKLDYDNLIIATGSKLDYEKIPNLKEHTYNFYGIDEAYRLREALAKFNGGKIVVGVAAMPHKCPPAPMEFVLLLEDYLKKIGLKDKVTIDFVYPLPIPFGSPVAGDMIRNEMQDRQIGMNMSFNIESVDPQKKAITSKKGDRIEYDLAVMVPPHTGSEALSESHLTDSGGWVPTERFTLNMKGRDDIYVLGDATDLPISKSGSVADFEADVIAQRISDTIKGYSPRKIYDGKGVGFVVTSQDKASMMISDYSHPPRPYPPSTALYWYKLIYNKIYWGATAKASLSSRVV